MKTKESRREIALMILIVLLKVVVCRQDRMQNHQVREELTVHKKFFVFSRKRPRRVLSRKALPLNIVIKHCLKFC